MCVLHAWGMTETTSIATICRLPPDLDEASDGRSILCARETGDARAVCRGPRPRPAGLVPWDGETLGELEVRGPTVASGYLQ